MASDQDRTPAPFTAAARRSSGERFRRIHPRTVPTPLDEPGLAPPTARRPKAHAAGCVQKQAHPCSWPRRASRVGVAFVQ